MRSEPLPFLLNDVFRSDLEKLYQEYFPKIYNYFFYQLLHKESAEDLTSRTFLKAAEHISDYNPDKAQISTWLWTIAQNTLIDFYRTQKPELSIDHETIKTDTALSVSFEEQYDKISNPARKALYMALTQLSERDRLFVYHKYFFGENYHDISMQFGINESTLATILQRAKAKLRKYIEE